MPKRSTKTTFVRVFLTIGRIFRKSSALHTSHKNFYRAEVPRYRSDDDCTDLKKRSGEYPFILIFTYPLKKRRILCIAVYLTFHIQGYGSSLLFSSHHSDSTQSAVPFRVPGSALFSSVPGSALLYILKFRGNFQY